MKTRLQTEAATCSLACLSMILSAHGADVEVSELCRRFPVSRNGASLDQIMRFASALNLTSRALRLELAELSQLQLPCILHWNLNHFVVLRKVTRRGIVVIDPAVGERHLSMEAASRHFTGVGLELAPLAKFERRSEAPRLRLSQLTGRMVGLRRAMLQIFAVALVLELFSLAAPLFNQMVIDDVVTTGDNDLLAVLTIGFALLLLVQTAIGAARSWMVMVLSQTISLQWSANLFAHLVRLPIDFFERRHLGDIVSRFGSLQAIQHTITTRAVEAVLDGLMAVAALIVMVAYSPTLALVAVAAVAGYGIVRWAAYAPLRDAAAERLVVGARESTHFLETVRAVAPLKLFGREQERRARWQNLLVDVQNRDVRTAKLTIGFRSANSLIFGAESLLTFWLGAKLIMATSATLPDAAQSAPFTMGMLFAFVNYKSQFTGRVPALIDFVAELKMLRLHAERLADIALAPPEQDEPLTRAVYEHDLAHLEPSLDLRGVSFRYGEGEPWILRNASMQVRAGESLAIVGASGAGKTTLLKIMLGLLQPSEGEVLYGGVPLRQLGLSNVRRQIGTVMQDDVLMTGSLAENISFFDVRPDQLRIEACARIARIHDDVLRLPMGYQTMVGDLGAGLSGGQKQRVLLARALYKQPRILAMDEATSHLDLDNENHITNAIGRMRLTRVFIAHRPQTISAAKRVVVIKDSQVFACKPHGAALQEG